MKTGSSVVALALTIGTAAAVWAAPAARSDDSRIAVPGPQPYQVAQEAAPGASAGIGSGFFYNSMAVNPFIYLKTDAITGSRSLLRPVWGTTYDYNHFAVGDSFSLTLQYMGQYFYYFSLPAERAFYHRGTLHLMKQFGDWNWHTGFQGLYKHPAFNAGSSVFDQLYYTVMEHPIGLFGFNLMNVGMTFDYFRSGVVGNSYYAPGIVFGYSPPLGDFMDTGLSYRLQYRFGLDGAPNGLRHIVSFNFVPNVNPLVPLNLNVGIQAQQGQPVSFFLSTGVGISPVLPLQKTEKPQAPGAGQPSPTPSGQPSTAPSPAANEPIGNERLKILEVPTTTPGDVNSPGSSPVDPGSRPSTRDVNVIFR